MVEQYSFHSRRLHSRRKSQMWSPKASRMSAEASKASMASPRVLGRCFLPIFVMCSSVTSEPVYSTGRGSSSSMPLRPAAKVAASAR